MNSLLSSLMISSQKQQSLSASASAGRKQIQRVLVHWLFNRCTFVFFLLLFGMCIQATATTMPPGRTITGIISSDGTWKFPKLRTDSNGNYYILHWDNVNNALRFVKWNGLTWEEYTSITASSVPGRIHISYGNDYQANYDFDTNDNLHVIFSAGTSSFAGSHDPYHGVYDGSSWTFTLVEDTANLPEEINLFVDAQNYVHTVYHVDAYPIGRQHILTYSTNTSGSWQAREILETTSRDLDELHDNYVVVDSNGKVSIVYRREDLQNLRQDNYYVTDSDNFTLQTKIPQLQGIADVKQYLVGNVTTDGNDVIHLVFSNLTDSTAHHLFKGTGNWVEIDLSSVNHTITGALDISTTATGLRVLTQTDSGYLFQKKAAGESWQDSLFFPLTGEFSDRFKIDETSKTTMLVYENSSVWEIGYFAFIQRKFPWMIFIPSFLPAH